VTAARAAHGCVVRDGVGEDMNGDRGRGPGWVGPPGRGAPPPPSGGGPGWGRPQRPPHRPPDRPPPPAQTAILPPDRPTGRRPGPSDRPAGRRQDPPEQSRRRPAAPARRRRPRWGRRIGVLFLVLALAVVGFGLYIDQSLDRTAALPADSIASSSGTNWLVVGSDSREGLSEQEQQQLATGDDPGQRTDTIMLVHSGSSGSVLVSLPRDSWVEIPGQGRGKLNAAYAFGGPELLVRTVEGATGLEIDHYAEIGFGGFVGAVDAVGGVELCVSEAISDPKAALDIQAGCQELDGPTALGYVRTRATAGSDFDRVERQRELLSALVRKATGPTTLLNPFRMVPLSTAMADAIVVDESDHVWHLAGLGWAMRGLSGGNGITTTVPVAGVGNEGGQSVVRWDRERALALFDSLADARTPPETALGP
jgi:LCP family protein required for cell wall assembly